MTALEIKQILSRNHEARNLAACKQMWGRSAKMGVLTEIGLLNVSSFGQLAEMGWADPEVSELDNHLDLVIHTQSV